MRSFGSQVFNKSFVFGQWILQCDGLLFHYDKTIHLPPKEMHVLYLLLDSAGSVLSKDWLLDKVWPNCDVYEGSLSRCIYILRKLFGRQNNFIKTIYGRGYRFEVDVVGSDSFSPVSLCVPPWSVMPLLAGGYGCGLELQGRLISERLQPVCMSVG